MEILKKGQIPQERSTVFSCKSCNSKLRAKASEGKFISNQRDGDYVIFACPVCSSDIWISHSLFNGGYEQG